MGHARRRLALELILAFTAASAVGNLFGFVLDRTSGWVGGAPWERGMLQWFHAHRLPATLDAFMIVIPYSGTNLTVLPALLLAALLLWRRGHRTVAAFQLIVVAVGSLLLNATLKYQHGRNRPDLFPARGWYSWSSYPSGHAIAVTSIFFTAALLLRREKGWRWPIAAAALVVLSNCVSRLYLQVHWPTDLIGGVLTGAVWLAGTWIAFRRYSLGKNTLRVSGRRHLST